MEKRDLSAATENTVIGKILASPLLLGMVIYVLLTALNFSCLDNPPYWDDILGLHNQAIWLAKHNFDISELWQPAQAYLKGGSNIYKFGIIPYFYAVLYSFFPPMAVHIIGHLFNLGCIALAFGASYSILRRFEVNKYLAFLWCLAALNEPVMAGRIVALGQECPLLCATVLSLYFIAKEKYWRGTLFVFIAMLCKMTAGILGIAFLIWLVIDIIISKADWKKHLKNNCPILLAVSLLICFFLFASSSDINGSESFLCFWFDRIKFQFFTLLPVQFTVLLAMIISAIITAVRVIRKKQWLTLSYRVKFLILLLITSGGFWSAYIIFYNPLPRYTAFIVFPMYIFLGLGLFAHRQNLAFAGALLFVFIGLVNINGSFFAQMWRFHRRSGEYLERSREYLSDLWANQTACKELETKYFNRPIVAKWPFVQMLTVPEMGYVSKALPHVYCACIPIQYAKVGLYRPKMKMPEDTLFIFNDNTFEIWTDFGPSLLPSKTSDFKIIYKNIINDGWFVVYEKRTQKEK